MNKNTEIHFYWDDAGGAHISHDEDLTLTDICQAHGGLTCVVAHNIFLNEGRAGVEAFYERVRTATDAYIADVEAGDTHGALIDRLPLD